MKPISRDATDDRCHFQIQQLAMFYFYHSSPKLQQKETGSVLQMGIAKKLSMAIKTTRSQYGKHRLIKPINLSWSKLWSPLTCPADRQSPQASSSLPALKRVHTSSRRDSSCFCIRKIKTSLTYYITDKPTRSVYALSLFSVIINNY